MGGYLGHVNDILFSLTLPKKEKRDIYLLNVDEFRQRSCELVHMVSKARQFTDLLAGVDVDETYGDEDDDHAGFAFQEEIASAQNYFGDFYKEYVKSALMVKYPPTM